MKRYEENWCTFFSALRSSWSCIWAAIAADSCRSVSFMICCWCWSWPTPSWAIINDDDASLVFVLLAKSAAWRWLGICEAIRRWRICCRSISRLWCATTSLSDPLLFGDGDPVIPVRRNRLDFNLHELIGICLIHLVFFMIAIIASFLLAWFEDFYGI